MYQPLLINLFLLFELSHKILERKDLPLILYGRHIQLILGQLCQKRDVVLGHTDSHIPISQLYYLDILIWRDLEGFLDPDIGRICPDRSGLSHPFCCKIGRNQNQNKDDKDQYHLYDIGQHKSTNRFLNCLQHTVSLERFDDEVLGP